MKFAIRANLSAPALDSCSFTKTAADGTHQGDIELGTIRIRAPGASSGVAQRDQPQPDRLTGAIASFSVERITQKTDHSDRGTEQYQRTTSLKRLLRPPFSLVCHAMPIKEPTTESGEFDRVGEG